MHFKKPPSGVIWAPSRGCEAYPTCQRSRRGITISQRSNQTHCFGHNERMGMEKKAGSGKRQRIPKMKLEDRRSVKIEDKDLKCQKIYKKG